MTGAPRGGAVDRDDLLKMLDLAGKEAAPKADDLLAAFNRLMQEVGTTRPRFHGTSRMCVSNHV